MNLMNLVPMFAFTMVGLSMMACSGEVSDGADGTSSSASELSSDAKSRPGQAIPSVLSVDDVACAVVQDLPSGAPTFRSLGGRGRRIRGDCGSLGIVDVDVSIYATIGYPQQCTQEVTPNDVSITPNPPPMTIIQMDVDSGAPFDPYNPPARYTSVGEAAGYRGSCSIVSGPIADESATSVAFSATLVDAFGRDGAKSHRVSYRAASAP